MISPLGRYLPYNELELITRVKVLYACDQLGTLLSLVTVFFISLFIHLFYYLVQAGHVLFCFLSQAGHAGNVISKQELI